MASNTLRSRKSTVAASDDSNPPASPAAGTAGEGEPHSRTFPSLGMSSSLGKRMVLGWSMVGGFVAIILTGHWAAAGLVAAIQATLFHEVISQGFMMKPDVEKRIPGFNFLRWYFFGTALYFSYGNILLRLKTVQTDADFSGIDHYHPFITLSLYLVGFMSFIYFLQKGLYHYQYTGFAYVHTVLALIIVTSTRMVDNIFHGMMWFVIPCLLVITNDSFAYFFGKAFGRTKLVPNLSPKKTVEGWIGGAISTFLAGAWLASWMSSYDLMVCPKTDLSYEWPVCNTLDNPDPLYVPTTYTLPESDWLPDTITMAPLQLHVAALSAFASVVAPFGGFFASGFKRAFNLKDFSDMIPGHGGITDRMDCQIIMGVCSNIYLTTFVWAAAEVPDLIQAIQRLPDQGQLDLYSTLTESLTARGLLS